MMKFKAAIQVAIMVAEFVGIAASAADGVAGLISKASNHKRG